jgi:prepilin-type N-terminal cleavage/methylation domain-containing protein
MHRIRTAGFTLIELLVVIGILSVLAVTLLPRVFEGQLAGNIAGDRANLTWHYQNLLEYYKNRKYQAPPGGGHQFVLAPWVKGICEHTAENRDRYFTPGQELDPRWIELKDEDPQKIWTTFEELHSDDTQYAGRAKKHFRDMWSGNEALMANDNEEGPIFADGTINVLMGTGSVRSLYKGEQLAQYWNDSEPGFYIPVGSDSPVPELQKLEH